MGQDTEALYSYPNFPIPRDAAVSSSDSDETIGPSSQVTQLYDISERFAVNQQSSNQYLPHHEIQLPIIEDVPANLDHFVLLSRQGHFNEAEAFYRHHLVRHEDWFAVVIGLALHLVRQWNLPEIELFVKRMAKLPSHSPRESSFLSVVGKLARQSNSTTEPIFAKTLKSIKAIFGESAPMTIDIAYMSILLLCAFKDSGHPAASSISDEHMEGLMQETKEYTQDLIQHGFYWEAYIVVESTNGRLNLEDIYFRELTDALASDTGIESSMGRAMFIVLQMEIRLCAARVMLETCLSTRDLERSAFERLDDTMELLSKDWDDEIHGNPKQKFDRAFITLSAHAIRLYLNWLGIDKLSKISGHAVMTCYNGLLAEALEAGYKPIPLRVDAMVDKLQANLQAIFTYRLDNRDVQENLGLDTLAQDVAMTAWSCGEQLYDLVSRNRRRTNGVPILPQECKGIQQIAELVNAIIAGLDFAQMHKSQLWKDTYEALYACCQPLSELQILLKDLRHSRSTSTRNTNAMRANRRMIEANTIRMMQATLSELIRKLNEAASQFSLLLLSKPGWPIPPPCPRVPKRTAQTSS